MSSEEGFSNKELLLYCSLMLFCFSAISFFTSMYYGVSESITKNFVLPNNGGEFGPIESSKSEAVFEVKVQQNLKIAGRSQSTGYRVSRENWSSIEVNVEDNEDHFIFSFGDDLWFADGYDEGYYWSESNESFDMKFVLPEKGKYYFDVDVQSNEVENIGIINVEITELRGSVLPFRIAGFIAVFAAIILLFIRHHWTL